MNDGLSWVQWVSVVEIPVLVLIVGGFVRYVTCLRRDLMSLTRDHTSLALDVAKNYVSISHMTAVEKRLELHLQRIEDKIDRGHGHD